MTPEFRTGKDPLCGGKLSCPLRVHITVVFAWRYSTNRVDKSGRSMRRNAEELSS